MRDRALGLRDPQTALRCLCPRRWRLACLGGSRIQRATFGLILVAAAQTAGCRREAAMPAAESAPNGRRPALQCPEPAAADPAARPAPQGNRVNEEVTNV